MSSSSHVGREGSTALPLRRIRSLKWSLLVSRNVPLLMVAPAVLILFGLTIYPFVFMGWISLHKWPIVPTLPRIFLGLGQYGFIFSDPSFWNSVRVTVVYMVVSVTAQLVLGFFLALLLSTPHRYVRYFRLPYMIPMFVSPVVVALIWRFMLGADLGIVNFFLRSIGFGGVAWLGAETSALFSVVLVDVWQWTPFTVLILSAGISSLPQEPFEAAAIDGATRPQMVRYLTVPMLMPVFTVVLLFRVLDAFKMFDIVFILTRGGPGDATNVLALNIWRKGFFENQLGFAAALSVIMIVIATFLAILLIRLMTRREVE